MGRVAEMVDPHCAHNSKGVDNKQITPPRRKACATTDSTLPMNSIYRHSHELFTSWAEKVKMAGCKIINNITFNNDYITMHGLRNLTVNRVKLDSASRSEIH